MKNRIEAIRKERGIRQEEFAKAMGVSRQTISSLENGRYNPSILLAYKTAKFFGMTMEEVFCFEEEQPTSTSLLPPNTATRCGPSSNTSRSGKSERV
ncbi:MAG: helix-turn-helix transcriptional regulator [Bacteroidales bacterium]|nr:helix-turn-helix transcriptional regulator [Bacteroidales bacterium]